MPSSDKADWVRTQTLSMGHTCHWPGCKREVPPAMWGCRPHWYKLPKHLRRKLWDVYEIGQEITGNVSEEYLKVAQEIQEWIRTHENVK